MNVKTLLHQFLTGCITTGTIAFIGAIPAISTTHNAEEIAPPLLAGTPFHIAQTAPLTGNWKLVNMTAADSPMPMLPTVEQTAEFTDGRIAGTGGCNRFMGSYETEGDPSRTARSGRLKISPLASTFMACEPDAMRQESIYLAALQGAQQYEVTPEGLTIAYQTEAGAGVLRFVAQTTGESGRESGREQHSEPVGEPSSQPIRGLW